MVGGSTGQGTEYFMVWLPVAVTVAQPVQATVLGKARLLDGFVAGLPGQAALLAGKGFAQPGARPGLVRAIPFHPGDALGAGVRHRRGVEVRAGGNHPAPAIGIQADETVNRPAAAVLLFHR